MLERWQGLSKTLSAPHAMDAPNTIQEDHWNALVRMTKIIFSTKSIPFLKRKDGSQGCLLFGEIHAIGLKRLDNILLRKITDMAIYFIAICVIQNLCRYAQDAVFLPRRRMESVMLQAPDFLAPWGACWRAAPEWHWRFRGSDRVYVASHAVERCTRTS